MASEQDGENGAGRDRRMLRRAGAAVAVTAMLAAGLALGVSTASSDEGETVGVSTSFLIPTGVPVSGVTTSAEATVPVGEQVVQASVGLGSGTEQSGTIEVEVGPPPTTTTPTTGTTTDVSPEPPPAGGTDQAAPPVNTDLEPEFGTTVVVAPTKGTVRIRYPNGSSFVLLTTAEEIPVESTIDATEGTVLLVSATGTVGLTQWATFWDGVFDVRQLFTTKGLTELILSGELEDCATAPGELFQLEPQRTRRLWGSGKGKFSTEGKYGSATVRGTTWLTEDDACDGTRVAVNEGVVELLEFGTGRTLLVEAGQSALARP